MIRAVAVLGSGERLLTFGATGHAAAGDIGYDLVCAAFSVLARTAYRSFEALPGVELRGSAPARGELAFEVLRAGESAERAAGIADFLVCGLRDLARDYPGAIEFTVEHEWRE